MSEFKGTKGKWEAVNNGPHWNNPSIENWEIHWSDDGECIVDHVYDKYDALLISKAPEMLDQLNRIHGEIMRSDGVLDVEKWGNQIEQLIKSATEI